MAGHLPSPGEERHLLLAVVGGLARAFFVKKVTKVLQHSTERSLELMFLLSQGRKMKMYSFFIYHSADLVSLGANTYKNVHCHSPLPGSHR